MAILYRTAKFKSTNSLAIAICAQPPNLIPANISGYTVLYYMILLVIDIYLSCKRGGFGEVVDHGVLGQTTEENIITLQSPHKVGLTVAHCSRLREGEKRERERE